MTSLQDLPPEIRKEIYKYLLVEPKTIGIMRYTRKADNRVARMDNHHNAKHRGRVYDTHKREWVAAPPSIAALLLVNKQITQEAREVLYGFNHFEFEHAAALESFLIHTGDAIHHLRHIALIGKGILYRGSWASIDRCLIRLAEAKALRTLEFCHLAFCYGSNRLEVPTLVEHCKPLLETLKATFDKQNLRVQVFDVIRITLPACDLLKPGHAPEDHPQLHYNRGWTVCRAFFLTKRSRSAETTALSFCSCRCTKAEGYNTELMRELREEVAEQLELDVDEE